MPLWEQMAETKLGSGFVTGVGAAYAVDQDDPVAVYFIAGGQHVRVYASPDPGVLWAECVSASGAPLPFRSTTGVLHGTAGSLHGIWPCC